MKCEVEIDVKIPDGYRVVRIGAPKKGELYIDNPKDPSVFEAEYDLQYVSCIIVEKCAKWRPAWRTEVIEMLINPNKHKIRLKSNPTLNIEIVSFDSKARCSVGVLWDAPKQRGISHYHTDEFEILEEPS
jgi:hypothetical protein